MTGSRARFRRVRRCSSVSQPILRVLPRPGSTANRQRSGTAFLPGPFLSSLRVAGWRQRPRRRREPRRGGREAVRKSAVNNIWKCPVQVTRHLSGSACPLLARRRGVEVADRGRYRPAHTRPPSCRGDPGHSSRMNRVPRTRGDELYHQWAAVPRSAPSRAHRAGRLSCPI